MRNNKRKRISEDTVDIKKFAKKEKKEAINIDYDKINKILNDNKIRTSVNDDVFSMFPHIHYAIEIMTSSIVSPNTMLEPDYNIFIENNLFPVEVINSLKNVIKTHIDTNYKFKNKLYEIVEETVYTKGSYAEIILPPNLVMDMYKKIKAKKRKVSAGLEDYISSSYLDSTFIDKKALITLNNKSTNIKISENYNYFLKDLVVDDFIDSKFDNPLGAGIEDTSITQEVLGLDEFIELDDTFSLPLVKKIPTDSIIPIADKDDPSQHYGYFVVLNNVGTAITDDDLPTSKAPMTMATVNEEKAKTISDAGKIIKKAKNDLLTMKRKVPTLDNGKQAIEHIVKEKLNYAIRNSVLKDLAKYDLDLKSNILDIIYDRVKQDESINIIFVPTRYLMYYAVDFRENGTGKSKLEEIQVLMSIKAMLMLSRIASYIRGNIVTTNVDLELDEDDPNPEYTLAKVLNMLKSGRQLELPLGMLKIEDITDWLHNVGFKVTAKHPGLPNINLQVSDEVLESNVPDDTLEEIIDKYSYLTLDITPEIVDNSFSSDFATTIVSNNILMNKRIVKRQNQFNPLYTKHMHSYIINDPILYNKIKDVLEGSLAKIKKKIKKNTNNDKLEKKILHTRKEVLVAWLYKQLLKSLNIRLPKPEFKDEDPMSDLFDKFNDDADKFLEAIFNTDMFPSDLLGDLSDKIDNQKEVVKGLLVYKWLSNNNVMPELNEMFSVDGDGNPVFNLTEEYKNLVEMLKSNIIPLLKEMNKFKTKSDKQLDKIENSDSDNDEDNSDENIDENTDENNDNTEESTEEDNTTEEGTDETTDEETTEEDNDDNDNEENADEDNGEENTEDNDEDDLTKDLF